MKADKKEDTKEPELLKSVDTEVQFGVIRHSPCGKYLCAGGFDGNVHRWDISGEEPAAKEKLTAHHGWVEGLVFAPEGETLYTADSWGQICAWKYAEENPQPLWKQEEAHDGWIRSTALSKDGKLLATGGKDLKVRVWSAADGKLVKEFPGNEEEVYSVAIHPDGKSVVSADLLGNVKHWDLESGELVREMRIEAMYFYDRIQGVAGLRIMQFHEDGKTLICAGAEPTAAGRSYGIPTIHLVDWEKLEITKSLRQGETKDGFIFDLAWHPDGYFMLVTSGTPGTGTVSFRRMDDEEPYYLNTKLRNCHSLSLHPDNQQIVVVGINARNQGNGAVRDDDGNYVPNFTPLHFLDLSPLKS